MAIKTKKTTKKTDLLTQLRQELTKTRLDIRAGIIKNTNAHKKIKKQIAQLLTKQSTK